MGLEAMLNDFPPRREDYMTDKQFLAAKAAYDKQVKQKYEILDWFGAALVVALALMFITAIGFVILLSYASFGAKGVAYLFASVGLFWAVAYEVKKRL